MDQLRYGAGYVYELSLGLSQSLGIPSSGDALTPTAGFLARSQPSLNDHEMAQQALPVRLHRDAPEHAVHPGFNRPVASGVIGHHGSDATPAFDPPYNSFSHFTPIDKITRAVFSTTPTSFGSQPHRLPALAPQIISNDPSHQALPIHPGPRAEHSSSFPDIPSSSKDDHENSITRVREKKHACWMCHKSFDRPSTLRKHLLVHTGERAFACSTCGRRFGVVSNLNRHTRRCVLRPVNAQARSTADGPAISAADGPSADGSDNSSDTSLSSSPPKPAAKRRRRAPSPSRWIPHSLLAFDLSPVPPTRATPVPFPPVYPRLCAGFEEERNSWDTSFGRRPYHPEGWLGRLPGPGLGRDIRGRGEFTMGRLIVS